jgi:hypothetical protein
MFVDIVNKAGGIGGSTYFKEHAADVARGRDAGSGRLYIRGEGHPPADGVGPAANLPLSVMAETERLYADAIDSGLASEEYTAI